MGSMPMVPKRTRVVVRSCSGVIGHGAELAAAVLSATKLFPHAALIVSAAERIMVELRAVCEDREEE